MPHGKHHRYRRNMKTRSCFAIASYLVGILLLHATACAHGAPQGLPLASNVLARLVQRAAHVAKDGKAEKYTYEKRSLLEELNAEAAVMRSTEKLYKVVLIQGWPFSRLIKIQGRELSEAEIRKEDQREQEFRNKIAGRDLSKRAEREAAGITPEVVARYNFKVLSQDLYQNRMTLVLDFTPKASNPENTIPDRIYNRLAGRIWVDDEDAEIAKMDVHLTEDLSLGWLGVLGSLRECHLILERQRLSDAIWVNAKQSLVLVGRKLLKSMRFRAIEESTGFHREP